jgi:hypothetical protein
MKVSENIVPGRIFGLKRGVPIRGWKKLYNEELYTHNLAFSPDIIRLVKSSHGG